MADKTTTAYAPYNFVPIDDKVFQPYKNIEELPVHNQLQESYLKGEIEYEIKVETPTIVGQSATGNNITFFKREGTYCIPGNTMKGLLRTNMITLGKGSVVDSVYDYRFLYRSFASNNKRLKKDYTLRMGLKCKIDERGKSYSIVENVKAGYIYQKSKEEYAIIPAKLIKGHTYFRVSEKAIHSKGFKVKGMNFMYNTDINKNIGSENRSYAPYSTCVYYDLNEESNKVKFLNTTQGEYKGMLLSANYMKGRTAHYVVNQKDLEGQEISIKKEEKEAFKLDKRKNKKIRGGHGQENNHYYDLPDSIGEGKAKPVFYIQYGGKLYFGFTPFLRLFYDKSTKQGLSKMHTDTTVIDYTRALFGFTNKENAYKGRVCVEDAICKKIIEGKSYTVLLAEPKASCITHYIEQNEEEVVSYNDAFHMRGIKHYWLKDEVLPQCSETNLNQNKTIYPVEKGSTFKGKITFEQLKEEELGLILWSLMLNEGCYQQVGLAKPYGFGRISIAQVILKLIDVQKKYLSFDSEYTQIEEPRKYIEIYQKYMKDNGFDFLEDKSVSNLFTIKTQIVSSKQCEFQYMKVQKKKEHNVFQDNNVLPTIEQIKKQKFKYANQSYSAPNKDNKQKDKKKVTDNPFYILKNK